MDVHANALEDAVVRGSAGGSQLVRLATMEGLASQYVAHRLSLLPQFDASVRLELVSIPQTVDFSRKEADVFLSFYNPRTPGLTSKRTASVAMHLYCSPSYLRRRGAPRTIADLAEHDFVGYIEELLSIDAVRWLDDLVQNPRMVFHSNSILAQCNAAIGDHRHCDAADDSWPPAPPACSGCFRMCRCSETCGCPYEQNRPIAPHQGGDEIPDPYLRARSRVSFGAERPALSACRVGFPSQDFSPRKL